MRQLPSSEVKYQGGIFDRKIMDFKMEDICTQSLIPEEFELEIDESQVVKEKSNREKWDIFLDKFAVNKDNGSMEYEARMARNHFSEIARRMEIATLLDSLGYDATKAYERIMEGK